MSKQEKTGTNVGCLIWFLVIVAIIIFARELKHKRQMEKAKLKYDIEMLKD